MSVDLDLRFIFALLVCLKKRSLIKTELNQFHDVLF